MENKELKVIADAMLEKKGQDVVSLDLRTIGTAISDHFIVCNADSTPAVVAIADNVEERMIEKCKRKVARAQGKENAFWVILLGVTYAIGLRMRTTILHMPTLTQNHLFS